MPRVNERAYFRPSPPGTIAVVMGVIVDPETLRSVAYWFHGEKAASCWFDSQEEAQSALEVFAEELGATTKPVFHQVKNS